MKTNILRTPIAFLPIEHVKDLIRESRDLEEFSINITSTKVLTESMSMETFDEYAVIDKFTASLLDSIKVCCTSVYNTKEDSFRMEICRSILLDSIINIIGYRTGDKAVEIKGIFYRVMLSHITNHYVISKINKDEVERNTYICIYDILRDIILKDEK